MSSKNDETSRIITSGQSYQYDAFISYRHVQPDKTIAEQLHKKLESFKLPKNVKASLANGHTRIERVFRDEEELTIASDLAEEIEHALKNSEWLIVVCSPRILESSWCLLEVRTFLKYHDRDHVLAVLAQGEPDEAIPEELLYEEVTTYNEQGEPTITKKRVEPLACDIRAKSTYQMVRNLESQKLRLIAAMFNLNYDDLRQRHRERDLRRKFIVVTVTMFIGILFMLICAFGLLMLYVQNAEIEAQAVTIMDHNQRLILSQAENMAFDSISAYNQDNRREALELAYASLTQIDGNQMPYTAVGQRALTQALDVYTDPGKLSSYITLQMPGVISHSELSPDKNYYLAFDELGNLYVWNTSTLENVVQISGVNNAYYRNYNNDSSYILTSDNKIIYISSEGIHLFNISTMENSLIVSGEYDGLTINSSQNFVAASGFVDESSFIELIDIDSMSVIHHFEWDELLSPLNDDATFIEECEAIDSIVNPALDGSWVEGDNIVYFINNYPSSVGYLLVIDCESMNVDKLYHINLEYVTKAFIIDNCLYYVGYTDTVDNSQNVIGCIDTNTDEVLWKTELGNHSTTLLYENLPSGAMLITYNTAYFSVLDVESGEIIGYATGFDNVLDIDIAEDAITFITSDNLEMTIFRNEAGRYSHTIFSDFLSSSLPDFATLQMINTDIKEAFISRNYDNTIYVYRCSTNPDLTSCRCSTDVQSVCYYPDSPDYARVLSSLNDSDSLVMAESVIECINGVVIVNMSNNTFSLYDGGVLIGNYDTSLVAGSGITTLKVFDYYGTDADGNYLVAERGFVGFRITPQGEVISVIYDLCGYNRATNTVIRNINFEYYSQPLYTVDELLAMAEANLADY